MTDQNLILLGTGRHPRTLEARRRNNHPRRTFWVGELFIQSKSRHSVTVAWARKNFEAIIKAIDTGCLQVTYGTDDFVDPAELRALCFPEKAASNEPWPWVSSFIARVGLATYNHIVRIQVAVGDSGMDFDKPDGLIRKALVLLEAGKEKEIEGLVAAAYEALNEEQRGKVRFVEAYSEGGHTGLMEILKDDDTAFMKMLAAWNDLRGIADSHADSATLKAYVLAREGKRDEVLALGEEARLALTLARRTNLEAQIPEELRTQLLELNAQLNRKLDDPEGPYQKVLAVILEDPRAAVDWAGVKLLVDAAVKEVAALATDTVATLAADPEALASRPPLTEAESLLLAINSYSPEVQARPEVQSAIELIKAGKLEEAIAIVDAVLNPPVPEGTLQAPLLSGHSEFPPAEVATVETPTAAEEATIPEKPVELAAPVPTTETGVAAPAPEAKPEAKKFTLPRDWKNADKKTLIKYATELGVDVSDAPSNGKIVARIETKVGRK